MTLRISWLVTVEWIALTLGGVTGLGLRLLFVPATRPEPSHLAWAQLNRARKARLALTSVAVVILAVVFAMLTGLVQL